MGSLRWEHPRHTSTKRSPHSRVAVRVASQVSIHWRDGTDCTSAQAVLRAICVLRAHTRNLKGGPLYALDGSSLPTTDLTPTATPVAKSEGGGKSKGKGSGKGGKGKGEGGGKSKGKGSGKGGKGKGEGGGKSKSKGSNKGGRGKGEDAQTEMELQAMMATVKANTAEAEEMQTRASLPLLHVASQVDPLAIETMDDFTPTAAQLAALRPPPPYAEEALRSVPLIEPISGLPLSLEPLPALPPALDDPVLLASLRTKRAWLSSLFELEISRELRDQSSTQCPWAATCDEEARRARVRLCVARLEEARLDLIASERLQLGL